MTINDLLRRGASGDVAGFVESAASDPALFRAATCAIDMARRVLVAWLAVYANATAIDCAGARKRLKAFDPDTIDSNPGRTAGELTAEWHAAVRRLRGLWMGFCDVAIEQGFDAVLALAAADPAAPSAVEALEKLIAEIPVDENVRTQTARCLRTLLTVPAFEVLEHKLGRETAIALTGAVKQFDAALGGIGRATSDALKAGGGV